MDCESFVEVVVLFLLYIYLNGYIYIYMIKIELNIRNRYRDFLYTNNWLCVAAYISVVAFENLS